jgi:parallel beta-helix repeat protein
MRIAIAVIIILILSACCAPAGARAPLATPVAVTAIPYSGFANVGGTQIQFNGQWSVIENTTTPEPAITAQDVPTGTATNTSVPPTITATLIPTLTATPTASRTATATQPSPTAGVGKAYYVDNSCASNGNGLSPACGSAFNSLAAAQAGVTGAQSDNRLLFRSGQTFAGQYTVNAYGTSGHPFTISAYGTGAKPIITGGSRNMYIGCSACQYIVIDGLELSYPTGGTNIYIIAPAKYITIRNSAIHHASSYGVFTWKATNIVIDSNDIYWSGSEGINIRMGDTALAIPGVVISNNKIHNNRRYGVLTNGMPGMQGNFSTSKMFGNEVYNNSTGIYLVFSSYWDIFNNNIHDNGKDCQGTNDCPGEDYGFAVQSGSYNEFHDNIVAYSESTGIAIYGEQSSAGNNADGNRVYRNIVTGTLRGAKWQRDINWQCWPGNSVGSNNQVFGNIFFGADMNFVIGDSNPALGGNVAYNNVFYGGNTGVFFEGTSTNAGWTLKNNIFAANAGQSIYANQRSGGLTLFNNIYYKPSGGGLLVYGGTNYTAANIRMLDANAITANPLFADASTWSGLRLQPGSPAIDAGLNLGVPFSLAFDPSNTTWPIPIADQYGFGTGWEIGAYVAR